MAQDEVFAGPMGESVPTSISSFAHRRGRADSTASFTYYPDDEEELLPSEEDSAILDDDESEAHFQDPSTDLEAAEHSPMRRTSSGYSRNSVHDRLLRSESARTEGSVLGRGHRNTQKIYIVTEDLTIVVAGFRSSTLGLAIYIAICVLTLGLGYLLLRWLPRWQVKVIGRQCALRDCTWVVIEVSTSVECLICTASPFPGLRALFWESYTGMADRPRINGENLWLKISSQKSTADRSQLFSVFQKKGTCYLTMRTMIP